MKKFSKTQTRCSIALSSVISASFAVGAVNAAVNPFSLTDLPPSTFQMAGVVAADQSPTHAPSVKSAEMACGAMMKDHSGQATGDMKGKSEMSCGAMMKNMPAGMNPEEMKAMCQKKMAEQKQPAH